jgi:L-rhamnose-H+ transport protein
MIAGVSLILISAILQGIFLLPMSRARQWAWEHVWLAFSLFGMILCNWILTLLVLPNPQVIFASVPRQEILILACFGLAWGAGAVMFGLGMDMLGLTLGYPLIMGLNASVGIVAIAGIWTCSVAGARRQSSAHRLDGVSHSRFVSGLMIAIASGVLSCLPNIGLAYGTTTIRAARDLGASPAFAGDAVWLIFFTCGGIVNAIYCCWLINRRKSVRSLYARGCISNWLWCLAMGAMWIGSFYLYGIGAAELGGSGATIGWPVLVSVSIAVGVLCGLGKGEWNGAPAQARRLLWAGLALIVLAVLVIPLGKVS